MVRTLTWGNSSCTMAESEQRTPEINLLGSEMKSESI